jgi:hypothetical protein
VAEEHGTPLADLEASAALLAPFNLVGSVLARKPPAAAEARRRWWQRWRGASGPLAAGGVPPA